MNCGWIEISYSLIFPHKVHHIKYIYVEIVEILQMNRSKRAKAHLIFQYMIMVLGTKGWFNNPIF